MEACYKEAYPTQAGSILSFGMVAKERHTASPQEDRRDEHHHVAVFCSTQHYWNKVAKASLARHVPLNAVAHDGYVTMFEYLRQPSAKKPLSELDGEPLLSERHPRDAALTALLEAGRKSKKAEGGKAKAAKRERAPAVFEVVRDKNIRSAEGLRLFAYHEAAAGRTALAEVCTRQGHKLEEVVANARLVLDAPQRALDSQLTRMAKLKRAAAQLPCLCGQVWIPGAVEILEANGIPQADFRAAVTKALTIGARRGCNVACIGEPGCGKSALLEPLEHIFKAAAKPQAGSTFPFASFVSCDVLLWQDFEHSEATMRFTDLLAFFVGESLDVRRPGQLSQKFRNTAPTFYTGRTPIRAAGHNHEAACVLDRMMDERFHVFTFWRPLPASIRKADWVHCGKCAAEFYLTAEASTASSSSSSPSTSSSSSSSSASQHVAVDGGLVSRLAALAALQAQGQLDDEEFRAAKRQLLCM